MSSARELCKLGDRSQDIWHILNFTLWTKTLNLCRLVHAITPLEENKSFLEKVNLHSWVAIICFRLKKNVSGSVGGATLWHCWGWEFYSRQVITLRLWQNLNSIVFQKPRNWYWHRKPWKKDRRGERGQRLWYQCLCPGHLEELSDLGIFVTKKSTATNWSWLRLWHGQMPEVNFIVSFYKKSEPNFF